MYYIYKITNKLNNKIYIGQVYNKTIYDRFNRHCKEANPNHPQYIDRAIYKYGTDNFKVELIEEVKLEDCVTHENAVNKLNIREIYWIKFFNSTDLKIGYNLTAGGDGGNTYLNKTDKELKEIKQKISIANSGKNNGMSKQIKALNTNTNEIFYFDTVTETLNFLGIKHKESIVDICNGLTNYLYKGVWNFAYTNNDFRQLTVKPKRNHFGIRKCYLLNKLTNEKTIYNTITEARKHTNLKPRSKENELYKIIDIL